MPYSADPHQFAGKNVHEFAGTFKPNGASAISNAVNSSGSGVGDSCGFTVARAGTGLYTVTLRESYPAHFGIFVQGYNLGVRWVDAVTVPGPLGGNGFTFQLQAKDATGAAADITAGATVFISFRILLKAKGALAA